MFLIHVLLAPPSKYFLNLPASPSPLLLYSMLITSASLLPLVSFPLQSTIHTNPELSIGLHFNYITFLLNTLQNVPIAFRIKPKFLTRAHKALTYLSSHVAHYHSIQHSGCPGCSQSLALLGSGLSQMVTHLFL